MRSRNPTSPTSRAEGPRRRPHRESAGRRRADRAAAAHVHGGGRRQPLEDRQEVLRRRESVEAHLRGQSRRHQEPGSDPSRPDAEDPRKVRRKESAHATSIARRLHAGALLRRFAPLRLSVGGAETRRSCRSAPAPAAAAPFQVTRIDLGNAVGADKKVAAPTTTFKPADTIYASIVTEGAAPSVDARGALDVRGRPARQRVVTDDRTQRCRRHRVPHRQARWLAGRQVQGRDRRERQAGRSARVHRDQLER